MQGDSLAAMMACLVSPQCLEDSESTSPRKKKNDEPTQNQKVSGQCEYIHVLVKVGIQDTSFGKIVPQRTLCLSQKSTNNY